MKIESTLKDFFLKRNTKKNPNIARNLEIITFYYGFRDHVWPTLEETAQKFDIGTRERVRQLLETKFRDHIKSKDIKDLKDLLIHFTNILNSKNCWHLPEFEEVLLSKEIIKPSDSIKGIFNLMDDIGLINEFDIYTPDLKKASRSTIFEFPNNLLIKSSSLGTLQSLWRKIKILPNLRGIGNLNELKNDLGEYYKLFIILIESSPKAWVKTSANDYWYIFEDSHNTLINYSQKVFCAIDNCESSELASTYRNALDARTIKGSQYPPTEIIKAYLESSIDFINNSGTLSFVGEKTQLNDIEYDLIEYLSSNKNAFYPELSTYLKSKGYEKPYIDKSLFHSPFIFRDKSPGRKNYIYRLVGNTKKIHSNNVLEERYEKHRRILRDLLNMDTNEAKEKTFRKEQSTLKD